MVVIHPKMKLQPWYPGKANTARQTLLRNRFLDRTKIRGWGRVFEQRRRRAILRGTLVSLLDGQWKPICLRHYKSSVAVTKSVWSLLLAAAAAPEADGSFDMLLDRVLARSKQGKQLDYRNHLFCVSLPGVGPRETVTLKLVAYPGDLGSTVYTIMQPLEK